MSIRTHILAVLSTKPQGLNVAKIHEIISKQHRVHIKSMSVIICNMVAERELTKREGKCTCCNKRVVIYSIKT